MAGCAPVEENCSLHAGYASRVARKILWASLALAPIVFIADFVFHLGDVALFVLCVGRAHPACLADRRGNRARRPSHGPGIGGFLNATFGNAPELIISLLAINKGLTEVVRGSLSGSVVGNLLLVLGFSLLFGRGDKSVDRESSFTWLGLIIFATLAFLVPAVPGWAGDPERDSLAILSLPVSIALLLLYVGVTWWQLRRHRRMHIPPAGSEGVWSMSRAIGVLAVATVVTAVIAEILVGSLETFAEKAHLSDFFVAAVIVAIVGNAAEHGGAVVVAYRGRSSSPRKSHSPSSRASRRLPDPGRSAPLLADRPARAVVPPGRDWLPSAAPRFLSGGLSPTGARATGTARR